MKKNPADFIIPLVEGKHYIASDEFSVLAPEADKYILKCAFEFLNFYNQMKESGKLSKEQIENVALIVIDPHEHSDWHYAEEALSDYVESELEGIEIRAKPFFGEDYSDDDDRRNYPLLKFLKRGIDNFNKQYETLGIEAGEPEFFGEDFSDIMVEKYKKKEED